MRKGMATGICYYSLAFCVGGQLCDARGLKELEAGTLEVKETFLWR